MFLLVTRDYNLAFDKHAHIQASTTFQIFIFPKSPHCSLVFLNDTNLASNYMFKVTIETLEQGVKYVRN